jgi:hypothetical protein
MVTGTIGKAGVNLLAGLNGNWRIEWCDQYWSDDSQSHFLAPIVARLPRDVALLSR